MSDSQISVVLPDTAKTKVIPVLRYAAGSALIMVIAMGADYTLSYLTPVLALAFLAPGSRPPTLASSLAFLAVIASASIAGLMFTRLFLDFPLVFLPMLALVIFHIYYTSHLQKMKMWLIISILLIPMVSLQTASLGNMVAVNLFINACIAIALIWVVYLIFPGAVIKPKENEAVRQMETTRRMQFMDALKRTIVVLPVLVLFFVFNWSDALLVLIFIAILSMNPATSNKKAGLAIIIANLGGGLAAIVVFNLLTVVPDIMFLGMIVLLTGLVFGKWVFSDKPAAKLFGMAFSSFLVILGNVASFRGEAGEAVWSRIFQLGIVVIYVVVAFTYIGNFNMFKTKALNN